MADAQLSVELKAEIQKYLKGMKDAARETQATESKISKASSAIGGYIAGAFSVGAVISFGKAVLDATAEYQKFQAVLGNTLGSSALANLKLKELQEFAAKTPFGVNELTASFVKLANSGFKPTGDQMIKLGDLASSTGKTFDQLTEAILDAQSGEFERLKEFGIRAKDAGDKVEFTYKGIQTQVEKTSGSIRNYITTLGEIEGVSGSMAVISETLGGKISNLGDSWDQMLISVGSNTDGVFNSAIDVIGDAIDKVTQYNKELNLVSKYKLGNNTTSFFEQLNRAVNPFASKGGTATELAVQGIKNAQDNVGKFVSEALAGAKSVKDFGNALAGLKKQGDLELKSGAIGSEKERAAIKDVYQEGVKALQDARKNFDSSAGLKDGNFGKTKGAGKSIKSISDILKTLDEDLKISDNQFKATFDDTNEGKIKNYQRAIDELSKKTGTDAVNAVNKLKNAQQNLFQLGNNTSLSGSVNQGLPAQRNSLGQVGLSGVADGSQVKDESLNKYKKQLADKAALVTDNQKFILENSKDFNLKFSALTDLTMISEGLGSAFGDIGSSLAAGASIFEAAGEGLTRAFGSIISALGQQFVQLGVAKIAAAALLTPFGAAMAAQGAGLVALGAGLSVTGGFVSSATNNNSSSGSNVTAFANGGIVSGPTLGLMGEYAGAKSDPEVVAPLSKLKDIIGFDSPNGSGSISKEQIIVLDHTISLTGQQLDIIIKRYNNTR